MLAIRHSKLNARLMPNIKTPRYAQSCLYWKPTKVPHWCHLLSSEITCSHVYKNSSSDRVVSDLCIGRKLSTGLIEFSEIGETIMRTLAAALS